MSELVRCPLYIIYGIRLKSSSEYRYIGLTTRALSRRMYLHLWNAKKVKPRLPVHKWLKKYSEEITVDVIQSFHTENRVALSEAEIFWIKVYRSLGHRLLNLDDGGLGGLNKTMPEQWSMPYDW